MGAVVEFFQVIVFLLLLPLVAVVGLVAHLLCTLSDVAFGMGKRAPSPKVIVITGATAGIGEALALRWAKKGVTLCLTGRNAERLKAVAKACTDRGAVVKTAKLDVADAPGLSAWLLGVDKEAPVDWVVANAGVSEETAGLERDVVAATKALFSANVDGVFNTILPLLPAMKERKSGRVVIMSSLAATAPLAGATAYSATKAAVRTYGEALRGLLYRDGVRVNVVCPGYVESDMTKALTHHLPGLMSMDAAVECIVDGLARDVAVIQFPFFIHTGVALVGRVLPPSLFHALARRRACLPVLNYLRARKGGSKKSS